MTWDWLAALVFLVTLVGLTTLSRYLVFRVPELERMRKLNREADRAKLSRKRFKQAVKINSKTGLYTNVVFYLTILPFCVSLEPRPLWRHAAEALAVLLTYDFFYYLTHRFLFHGRPLQRIHALHHQAHTPTHIDALYVHPLETFIGLALFLGSMPLIALATGAPLSAFAMAVATLVFTEGNTVAHCFIDLPRFPFKTLDRFTSLHAAHHVDMKHGNYATLTMIWDRLFGTYEKPVHRAAP